MGILFILSIWAPSPNPMLTLTLPGLGLGLGRILLRLLLLGVWGLLGRVKRDIFGLILLLALLIMALLFPVMASFPGGNFTRLLPSMASPSLIRLLWLI